MPVLFRSRCDRRPLRLAVISRRWEREGSKMARGWANTASWYGAAGLLRREIRNAQASDRRESACGSVDRDRHGGGCHHEDRNGGRKYRDSGGEQACKPMRAGLERPSRRQCSYLAQRTLLLRKGPNPTEMTDAARPIPRVRPAFRPSARRIPQPAKGVRGESTRTYATPAFGSRQRQLGTY
jgi:hypothetical protein